jgi:hypothetical protein
MALNNVIFDVVDHPWLGATKELNTPIKIEKT